MNTGFADPHLTREMAAPLSDPRHHDCVRHHTLALLRQRVHQIVADYEDANDADRLRHDPMLQIVADQKLGDAMGSQPRSAAGRTRLLPGIYALQQFAH